MKAQRRWSIAGTIFTLAAGALLHFTYQWFGGIFWAAVGAVNESTWEHLKLLTTLLFLVTVLESFFRPGTGLPASRLAGTLIGMLTILTGYYLYSGAFGLSHLIWLDIVLFAAAVFWLFCLAGNGKSRLKAGHWLAGLVGLSYWSSWFFLPGIHRRFRFSWTVSPDWMGSERIP